MSKKILIDQSVLEQALKALDEIAWSTDTQWQSDCADSIRLKLRAALEQPQSDVTLPASIPPGWKLVPVNPTEEMMEAMIAYNGTYYTDAFDRDDFLADYQSMLDAAEIGRSMK